MEIKGDSKIGGFLKDGALELGLVLSEEMVESFLSFKAILLEWNEKMNLTAITDDMGFLTKHFFDSLSVAKYIPLGADLIDVGTGAGFPGIPLLLARPDINLTLLDSLNKRLIFLKDAVEKLKSKNVSLIHSRAEDAGKDINRRELYNVSVSRAVANLALLSEYCLPFVKPGGLFIAMKGPKAVDELDGALDIINKLGGELSLVDNITLPFSNVIGEEMKRVIFIIRKVRQTPLNYPRSSAELTKIYKKNV